MRIVLEYPLKRLRRQPGAAAALALASAQIGAAAVLAARLSRGRRRRAPLRAGSWPDPASRPRISVVIPARDEESRIAPCLDGLASDPDVDEVIVVDDRSTDATAEIARALGARVVCGIEPPPGWVGKPWALQQGLEAASGDVVVSLDADTRPRAGLVGALARALDEHDADLVTCSARFVCDGAAQQALHAALLATLVHRYGPADAARPVRPSRLLSNGQCTAIRREPLLADGGYAEAAGHMTDDAAFARARARAGAHVVFLDGTDLIDVRMYESAAETWREWGRSIALPDVTSPARQAGDLALVWLTMGLPVLRLAARRPTRTDLVLLAVRGLLLVALRRAYRSPGPGFWLSPALDPLAALRLTLSALRPAREWRGRRYDDAATPPRTAPR